MEGKVIFTGERCVAYKWSGVTDSDEAPAIKCDTNVPYSVQVRGEFTKAFLDGSCDGLDWDTVCTFQLPGIKNIEIRPLYLRPRVVGGEASITVNIRR